MPHTYQIILSHRKESHIIHVTIGCLLVGKMLDLFDNTSQILIQIFVPTSQECMNTCTY